VQAELNSEIVEFSPETCGLQRRARSEFVQLLLDQEWVDGVRTRHPDEDQAHSVLLAGKVGVLAMIVWVIGGRARVADVNFDNAKY
jgi:hypothetical protein